jgi:hypothetical protein
MITITNSCIISSSYKTVKLIYMVTIFVTFSIMQISCQFFIFDTKIRILCHIETIASIVPTDTAIRMLYHNEKVYRIDTPLLA